MDFREIYDNLKMYKIIFNGLTFHNGRPLLPLILRNHLDVQIDNEEHWSWVDLDLEGHENAVHCQQNPHI